MTDREIQGLDCSKRNGVGAGAEDTAEKKQPDDCILEMEDLEKVSGGGLFSEIVSQADSFTPNTVKTTKNHSGHK